MASPTSSRRRLFRIMMAIPVPLLLLGAVEVGLRVFGFEHQLTAPRLLFVTPDREWAESHDNAMTVPDPELFWRMKPGWGSADGPVFIRPSGYRTPPFTPKKRAVWHRVVCIGDSITFGLMVEEHATWPRILEGKLKTARVTEAVEVVNLGVPGYTAVQGLTLLTSDALDLEPDAVIVGFGAFNDWVPAIGRTDFQQQAPPAVHGLRLVQLVSWLREDEPELAPADRSKLEDLRERIRTLHTTDHGGARRVPLQDFERALTQFGMQCEERGVEVVFVANALPAKTLASNPIAARYAEITRAVASKGGYKIVDGWKAFDEAAATDQDLFEDFCHPSALGHRILANAVADALARRAPANEGAPTKK